MKNKFKKIAILLTIYLLIGGLTSSCNSKKIKSNPVEAEDIVNNYTKMFNKRLELASSIYKIKNPSDNLNGISQQQLELVLAHFSIKNFDYLMLHKMNKSTQNQKTINQRKIDFKTNNIKWDKIIQNCQSNIYLSILKSNMKNKKDTQLSLARLLNSIYTKSAALNESLESLPTNKNGNYQQSITSNHNKKIFDLFHSTIQAESIIDLAERLAVIPKNYNKLIKVNTMNKMIYNNWLASQI